MTQQSSDLLKPEKPTPLAEVGKLPKGLNTYGGSKFGKKISNWQEVYPGIPLAPEDDERRASRRRELVAEMAAAGPQGDFSASMLRMPR